MRDGASTTSERNKAYGGLNSRPTIPVGSLKLPVKKKVSSKSSVTPAVGSFASTTHYPGQSTWVGVSEISVAVLPIFADRTHHFIGAHFRELRAQ